MYIYITGFEKSSYWTVLTRSLIVEVQVVCSYLNDPV
jgi:hypothetical protein